MSLQEKQSHIRKEPSDWFLYQKIIFNTMMEELSHSYERPVTIGHFMGYTPGEIMKTIDFFCFELYQMRYARKYVTEEQFYGFRI
jgi:hypothetical protein